MRERETHVVEVAGVDFRVERGDEGCFPFAEVVPIHAAEERVLLDLVEGRHAAILVGDQAVPGMGNEAEAHIRQFLQDPTQCDLGLEDIACAPSDSGPAVVAQVENQVLRTIIVRSPQDALPVLEVRPRLVWRRSRKGWEARQEPVCVRQLRESGPTSSHGSDDEWVQGKTPGNALEQDAAETPVIHRIRVALTPQGLDRHIVGRTDDRIGVPSVGEPQGLVDRFHLERRAVHERRVVGDFVQLRRGRGHAVSVAAIDIDERRCEPWGGGVTRFSRRRRRRWADQTDLVFEMLDLARVERTSREAKVGQLDMARRVDQEVLQRQVRHNSSHRQYSGSDDNSSSSDGGSPRV